MTTSTTPDDARIDNLPSATRERLDMRHWYPRLAALDGVQTPATVFVETDRLNPMPGEWLRMPADIDAFAAAIKDVGGLPVFLRSEYRSGKRALHEASRFDTNEMDALIKTLNALADHHDMHEEDGFEVLAVREWLDLKQPPADATSGVPVASELRAYVRDGEPLCAHWYWDQERTDIEADAVAALREHALAQADDLLAGPVAAVAEAFDGAWSVDFAETADGEWVAIDMAPVEVSWRPADCEHLPAEAEVSP